MAIVVKEMATVAGWTVDDINREIATWGANPKDVALEVETIGNIGIPVPALVWYTREDGDES